MMRDAAGNDVRIETPVAIAVERSIVDDHGVVHNGATTLAPVVSVRNRPRSPAFPRRSLDAN